jgi:hypothetical protein
MGRPKRPVEEVMVDIPCKVLPETAEIIELLSKQEERSKSFIARKLITRGLAAYERDGSLDEPEIAAARAQLTTDGMKGQEVRPKSLHARGGAKRRAAG